MYRHIRVAAVYLTALTFTTGFARSEDLEKLSRAQAKEQLQSNFSLKNCEVAESLIHVVGEPADTTADTHKLFFEQVFVRGDLHILDPLASKITLKQVRVSGDLHIASKVGSNGLCFDNVFLDGKLYIYEPIDERVLLDLGFIYPAINPSGADGRPKGIYVVDITTAKRVHLAAPTVRIVCPWKPK